MAQPDSVFEQTYRNYLNQVARLDFQDLSRRIGAALKEGGLLIPLFGQLYRVSPAGIIDPSGKEPIHSARVVLCKYLLLYPAAEPQGREWVSYRDFKNAAPFVGGFQKNTEEAIARNFAGKLEMLRKVCLEMGGRDPGFDWNYQLKMKFTSLPQIPLILLFNDEDEEFPAQCLILFERRAAQYLDMECLAILAWLLADLLYLSIGEQRKTVM